MMKLHTRPDIKTASQHTSKTVHVCLHVVRAALHDVRAMRAARSLAAAGYSVTILDVDSVRKQRTEDVDGVHLHHLRLSTTFHTTRFERWTLLKALLIGLRCLLQVVIQQADIYHASEVTALPACYLAARLHRKPLIFEAYELPLEDRHTSEMNIGRTLLRAVMARFLTHALPRCSAILAVSPPIVQEMKKRYHVNNVYLLRNLPLYQDVARTDRLREALDLSASTRIALYQGYLQADRGLDRLVQAAPFLDTDVMIVMMGQGVGDTRTQLEALIASKGVRERIRIIDPVPYDELLSWTSSADIGLALIPLDYTLNMRMALPNKVFEYVMAGVPILSSPLESVAELLTQYQMGQVVPAMDPASIGATINALIHDTEGLIHMRANALQAARTLCWEEESPHLLQLYAGIANL